MHNAWAAGGASPLPHGGTADVRYAFEDLPGGTPVSTFEVAAVPEPCTAVLVACGLSMLLAGRRRWTDARA
ncbi:MAG TPA: hypothetical protein VMZ92_21685 [Planctomycetota bacterium]|nr:hypothetical protein [Planctomycetota bacterium]